MRLLLALPVVALLLAACGAPTGNGYTGNATDTLASPVVYGPEFRLHGGVRYFTSAHVTHGSPQALHARLAAYHPRLHMAPLPEAMPHQCALAIHFVKGTRAVWHIEPSSVDSCLFADRWRASHDELEVLIPVAEILGDSLPPGEYQLHTVLHLPADTLMVEHGVYHLSSDTLPPVDGPPGVEIAATQEHLSPHQIGIRLLLRSQSERTIRMTHAHEGCSLDIRFVYRADPQREWRQPRGCPDIEMQTFIYPGQVRIWPEYPRIVDLRGVLGDTLPSGSYLVSVRFVYDGLPRDSFRRDTAVFQLGPVEITR